MIDYWIPKILAFLWIDCCSTPMIRLVQLKKIRRVGGHERVNSGPR